MGSDIKKYHYIDDNDSLVGFIKDLKARGGQNCAIDTEADSLHCYEEKLCLIQFAAEDSLAVIDPLKVSDFSSLIDYLDTVNVWMHGADFDIRMLSRSYGRAPKVVYDTQTASRLLGVRKFGLVNLVEDHFGVVLPKTSQKANWGKRPLSEKMLEYAVNDVRYLLEIAQKLTDDLNKLNRWDWFVESCDHTKLIASQIKEKDLDMIWRISGWGKLENNGMAYLKALWFWRDGEASRRDKPTFKIIGNNDLLRMANELQEGTSVKLPDRFPTSPVKRFESAIEGVSNMDPENFPKLEKRKRLKKNPKFDSRFNKLKSYRDKVSNEIGIDPTLIASRSNMEGIAHDPDKVQELLLNWQRELLVPALERI